MSSKQKEEIRALVFSVTLVQTTEEMQGFGVTSLGLFVALNACPRRNNLLPFFDPADRLLKQKEGQDTGFYVTAWYKGHPSFCFCAVRSRLCFVV